MSYMLDSEAFATKKTLVWLQHDDKLETVPCTLELQTLPNPCMRLREICTDFNQADKQSTGNKRKARKEECENIWA